MGLGFVVGFWGLCGTLVFVKSWRYEYIKFLNSVGDRIYVTVALQKAKLSRMITFCTFRWPTSIPGKRSADYMDENSLKVPIESVSSQQMTSAPTIPISSSTVEILAILVVPT
ncbi:hypothetical protein PanWU01x14_284160 [Parasponia andersonii]|uniref:Uncharacterized protein n=1 Tax=Parasponia andersonii TaxID=3476 RepID=A0A2P5AZY9_PARAD|nr:hypothetical protein PanWU01x14_284160 [Parasponia andersonii]